MMHLCWFLFALHTGLTVHFLGTRQYGWGAFNAVVALWNATDVWQGLS